MGCEFSDKVRAAKREIVFELYSKMKPEYQKKFDAMYKHPHEMAENETYQAYAHVKRALKSLKVRK